MNIIIEILDSDKEGSISLVTKMYKQCICMFHIHYLIKDNFIYTLKFNRAFSLFFP